VSTEYGLVFVMTPAPLFDTGVAIPSVLLCQRGALDGSVSREFDAHADHDPRARDAEDRLVVAEALIGLSTAFAAKFSVDLCLADP
jgi:hypothetical protein